MSFQLICTSCGKGNTLGQMFCRHCGTRLNPRSVKRIRHIKPGPFLWRGLRVFCFLSLVAMLVLALWRVPTLGKIGGETHAKAFKEKVLRLERAADKGYSIEEVISESQVNAYFAQIVSHTLSLATEKSAMEQVIREINVAFTPDSFTVSIIADWGPLQLTHELQGVPVIGENGFSVRLGRVRFGHLPLPAVLRARLGNRMMTVFKDLSRERDVLDSLKSFALGEKRIFVST